MKERVCERARERIFLCVPRRDLNSEPFIYRCTRGDIRASYTHILALLFWNQTSKSAYSWDQIPAQKLSLYFSPSWPQVCTWTPHLVQLPGCESSSSCQSSVDANGVTPLPNQFNNQEIGLKESWSSCKQGKESLLSAQSFKVRFGRREIEKASEGDTWKNVSGQTQGWDWKSEVFRTQVLAKLQLIAPQAEAHTVLNRLSGMRPRDWVQGKMEKGRRRVKKEGGGKNERKDRVICAFIDWPSYHIFSECYKEKWYFIFLHNTGQNRKELDWNTFQKSFAQFQQFVNFSFKQK